jgi:TonB family protein
MLSPFLGPATSQSSTPWLTRIRENLAQLIAPSALTLSSSNGASIHLLKLDRTGKAGSAQTVSLLVHAGILAILLALAARVPIFHPPTGITVDAPPGHLLFSPQPSKIADRASLGHASGGGEDNPIPPTHGFLPPHSSIQLVSPRLPDHQQHELPVAVTIFDQNAPPTVSSVTQLGLPRMPNDTDSPGPGSRHGAGTGIEGGFGDKDGPGDGEGVGDTYGHRAVAMPVCMICPLPLYTDEARHVKVQGTVTLRALVGADGRAQQVRILRGPGYGLEQRAEETVRGWKFRPARDAANHTISTWVIVEAVFRLI